MLMELRDVILGGCRIFSIGSIFIAFKPPSAALTKTKEEQLTSWCRGALNSKQHVSMHEACMDACQVSALVYHDRRAVGGMIAYLAYLEAVAYVYPYLRFKLQGARILAPEIYT